MSFRRNWVPNQHGAWAFIVSPSLFILIEGGTQISGLLLCISWLLAYCFNYYFTLIIKSNNLSKWKSKTIVYGLLTTAFAFYPIYHSPRILILAPIMIFGFVASLFFVKAKKERSFFNDLIGIVLSGVIALTIANMQDGIEPQEQTGILLISTYFVGTVFYVKTMIREKGRSNWLWFSYLWHGLFIVLSLLLSPITLIVSIIAFAKVLVVPNYNFSPKMIGIAEFFLTMTLILLLINF